jgi:hypothetical protein
MHRRELLENEQGLHDWLMRRSVLDAYFSACVVHKKRRPPMRFLLTALLLGSMATATLAQTATPAPTTKADCEKVKDMKWDEKGGKDSKGACVKK